MIELRKADARGVAEHGWLSSRHTFSFAQYDDPRQRGFSDLLVINDDRVAPARGFNTHPHHDMEILSYVLEGALEHRDTLDNGSIIRPGDVQMMSAGTGIAHSEYNPSDTQAVHFLQIWIVPGARNLTPEYQQTHIADEEKRGRLRLIVSPDGRDGSLRVHQDADVYAGLIDGDETATIALAEGRAAYVHVARGALSVNGVAMNEGDGMKIRDERSLCLDAGRDAEVLLFDLRGQGAVA
jgi:redox-sensitive bicupin YhaK (pirin superfamily)